jgi:ankyrin repeat protein
VLDDKKLTEWLLTNGAEPNAECEMGCTPLSIGVRRASFSTIKMLFDRSGSIQHGQLLKYAVNRDEPEHLEVIDFLVEKGAPINDVMHQHRLKNHFQSRALGLGTTLHIAAEMGKLGVAERLLARGADPLVG